MSRRVNSDTPRRRCLSAPTFRVTATTYPGNSTARTVSHAPRTLRCVSKLGTKHSLSSPGPATRSMTAHSAASLPVGTWITYQPPAPCAHRRSGAATARFAHGVACARTPAATSLPSESSPSFAHSPHNACVSSHSTMATLPFRRCAARATRTKPARAAVRAGLRTPRSLPSASRRGFAPPTLGRSWHIHPQARSGPTPGTAPTMQDMFELKACNRMRALTGRTRFHARNPAARSGLCAGNRTV